MCPYRSRASSRMLDEPPKAVERITPAPWRSRRARVASLSRVYPDDSDVMRDARRALQLARLEHHIFDVVDAGPPMTIEQRARLMTLLLAERFEGGVA